MRLWLDPVGGSDAQRAAEQELRHGEYHRGGPGILQRIMDWFGRHLDSLLKQGTGASHAELVLLVLLLAVIAVALVKVGLPKRSARRTAGESEDPLRPVEDTDHRRLAAQFAAQGRRAEAVREWLRAAVQTIEDRGILPPQPGRTGASTARGAGPLLPAASAELRAATAAFDEIWFGGRDATDADVAHAHAAADAVRTGRIQYATPTTDYVLPR